MQLLLKNSAHSNMHIAHAVKSQDHQFQLLTLPHPQLYCLKMHDVICQLILTSFNFNLLEFATLSH